MSQTQCPSCGLGFDNGRILSYEDLRGRMLYGPERLGWMYALVLLVAIAVVVASSLK